MTIVNAQSHQRAGRKIVGSAQEHMEGTRTRKIPALATLLYVGWIPQDNGSPPALPSIVVDRHKGAAIAIS